MEGDVTLVTGGAGFVGSNLVRSLLERDPIARVLVLDRAVDALAEAFFAPFTSRIRLHRGDITDPDALDGAPWLGEVTQLVHGAMVAHVPSWELAEPARFVHVNIGGTATVLDWARDLPALRRFLYIGSGGVYGEPTELSPDDPQPETGPFNPAELYGISKYSSELICARYADLFDLDLTIVRLSWVFGRMERVTSGRALMSPPYAIARSFLEDRPVKVTRRALGAVGDFLSSEEIAGAIATVLEGAKPGSPTYNIAAGELTSFEELLDAATRAHPAVRYTVVADDDRDADLDHDPSLRRARWNAYDISRIRDEFGWEPRPLVEQLATYFAWVAEDPATRCPAVSAIAARSA